MKQLAKNEPDNYFNMQFLDIAVEKDFFIRRIIMGYLVLFHTCQEFNLLNNNEFPTPSQGDYKVAVLVKN